MSRQSDEAYNFPDSERAHLWAGAIVGKARLIKLVQCQTSASSRFGAALYGYACSRSWRTIGLSLLKAPMLDPPCHERRPRVLRAALPAARRCILAECTSGRFLADTDFPFRAVVDSPPAGLPPFFLAA